MDASVKLASRSVRAVLAVMVALGGVVYALFAASAVPGVMTWITNSDQLTVPALVVDVLARPADFFGWQISRSSYLFPDALAYAVAYLLSGDALRSITFAHVTTLLVWVYVVYRASASRGAGFGARLAWVVLTALLVPLALTQLSTEAAAWVTKYLFSIANHFSCFVIGMLLVWWTLDEFRAPSWGRLVAIGIVGALTAASNRAIWLFYALPAVIIVAAYLLRDRQRALLPAAKIVTVGSVGLAIGYAIEGSFNRLTLMPFELTTDSISGHTAAFFTSLATYAAAHPLALLAGAALIAVYAAVALRLVAEFPRWWRRDLNREREVGWLFQLATITTAVANLLVGMISWINIGNARYLVLFFFAPPLLIPGLWRGAWPTRVLVAATIGALALTLVATLRLGGSRDITTYARQEVSPVVACLERLGVGRGLANYWQARHLAFLSQGAIRVDQVSPGATSKEALFFYSGNNAYDFLRGAPDVDPYDYVLADDLDHDVLRAAFGAPDAAERCAGREIWMWRDKTRVFAGLFQGHLDPWERLLEKDSSVRIPASAFPGGTGAIDGTGRRAGSDESQGDLIAGGRLSLSPATYRFAVSYSGRQEASGRKLATLTIKRADGQAAFVDLPGTNSDRTQIAQVTMRVDGPGQFVDVRVAHAAHAALLVEDLAVTRVPAVDAREIRLEANDTHIHTQVGLLRDGVMQSMGKGGVLAFGPYLPLPAGRYRATVHLVGDRAEGRIGKVDAVADVGRAVLAEQPIDGAAFSAMTGQREVMLDFDLPRPVRDLELRVFVEEGASLALKGYEILPRSGNATTAVVANPTVKSAP